MLYPVSERLRAWFAARERPAAGPAPRFLRREPVPGAAVPVP
jgi:hypothetical protein